MGGVEREAPAAEGGIGDDAAPAPAGERDAGEARGVVGRDAEDLLDDLVWQRRRRARALRRHAADLRPVRLASQPPASSTFLSEQTTTSNQPTLLFSHNKSAPAISHQPNEQAVGLVRGFGIWIGLVTVLVGRNLI
jgi:hypothetical protein